MTANHDAKHIVGLIRHGTRADLIDWLCWNDGNGVYTDTDNENEGYKPLTLDEARELVQSIAFRDEA